MPDLMTSPVQYSENPKAAAADDPYYPSPELTAAVNVALLLGRPLLVTGAPGTGKTSLARSVAADLGLPYLRFDTKSGSMASDLFYRYDAIRHFRKSQTSTSGEVEVTDFIQIQRLGEAMLRAMEPDEMTKRLLATMRKSDETNETSRPPAANGAPTRSVVLIDEVDKAPRDFPNDLLNELEEWSFEIPETGRRRFKVTRKDMRPILILTSNSEKNLPDAFVRRCIYFDMPFPDDAQLERIVLAHLQGVGQSSWLGDALRFFKHLRAQRIFSRLPGTAELLDWMRVLSARPEKNPFLPEDGGKDAGGSLHCLFKTRTDLEQARRELGKFLAPKQP